MRERLKAIREAGARISGSQTQAAPGATPGFVAALRAARAETPAEPARIARRTPATAIVAITRHGVQLAACALPALPGARLYVPEKLASEAEEAAPGAVTPYAGKTGELLGRLFGETTAIVAILSIGAMVRLIAPHLQSKESDPAIVVLDEAGRFAIPILSGHLGGANTLARQLAAALDATAVLTTASDVRETIAVDLLGREFGWTLEASHDTLVRVSGAMVNDEPVALVQEAGRTDWWSTHADGRDGPLPANLSLFVRLEDVPAEAFAAVLWISRRTMPDEYVQQLAGRCVTYRPGDET